MIDNVGVSCDKYNILGSRAYLNNKCCINTCVYVLSVLNKSTQRVHTSAKAYSPVPQNKIQCFHIFCLNVDVFYSHII